MAQGRHEILAGISHLSSVGIPGGVEIFGDNVEPVLTVGGDAREAVMAAGVLGQGRVLVVAHDGYALDIKHGGRDASIARLHSNMKKWLLSATQSSREIPDENVVAINENYRLSRRSSGRSEILMWRGGNVNLSEGEVDKVISSIRAGGAFLHAMCPWGWLQLNPGKRLQDMPFHKLLDTLGVRYTLGYVDPDRKGFDIPDCAATGAAHVDNLQSTLSACHIAANPAVRESECWRNQLLAGISVLPCIGMPGSIVVYGEQAEPILCGEDDAVIIAAAELGQGRVLVIAHDGYIQNFDREQSSEDPIVQKLHTNMKHWLSPERRRVTVVKKSLDLAKVEKGKDLLVWCDGSGSADLSEGDARDVLAHVAAGGAFLHAMCPWGWLQLHPGKSLEDMPFHEVLHAIGVCYTTECAQGGTGGFDFGRDVCSAHIGHILSRVVAGDSEVLGSHGNVVGRIRFIPNKEKRNLDGKCGNLLHKCAEDIRNCLPSKHNPVKDKKAKAVMAIHESLSDAYESDAKAPGVEFFPGDFKTSPHLVCVDVEVESLTKDVHPTGFYLPAGGQLNAAVSDQTGSVGKWRIQIGAHSDDLSGQGELRRWPVVTKQATMKDEVTRVSSRFGGLVYLFSPEGRGTIHLQLQGVVEAPHFDLTDANSVEKWRTRRDAPGLWADMCGEFVTFTVPSSSVRLLDDPGEVLRSWDRVVQAHHHLRGSDIRRARRQWVVADEQPSAGYMHSGYPVVTHLDITQPSFSGSHDNFVFNNEGLVQRGNWGLFHEIGHNMQRDTWTFEGTVEVTCNIFTLHAMEVITQTKPLDNKWVREQASNVKKYLAQNAPFKRWKEEPGVALMVYAQVAHYLGWDCYKDVFRQYETLPAADKPTTTQQQIDQWFTRLSLASGYDMRPMLEFWGIPFSDSAKKQVRHLPAFLPEDALTGLAPERFRQTSGKYPDVLHQVDDSVRRASGRYSNVCGACPLQQPTTRTLKK